MKVLELSFQDWIVKNKIKNIILKSISFIFSVIVVLGMMAADSESNIPFIMIIVPLCWLVPFCVVNGLIEN